MDYRETNDNGPVKSWRRAHTINVLNPYKQMPTIQFHEEDRTMLPDGRTMVTNNTAVECEFSDPSKTFPLLHPVTGEVIGQAAYQDVYVMLFSLYMALAGERDKLATDVATETVTE